MRLSWLSSLPALLAVVSALAIEKRDADFFDVRTRMHKDMSGKRGDPKGKYFRESPFPARAFPFEPDRVLTPFLRTDESVYVSPRPDPAAVDPVPRIWY